MGILDDAIRQHLELMRQSGADESALRQLEDEAFGPPTRPGEPDFPSREGADPEPAGEQPPPEASPADAETRVEPVAPPELDPVEAPSAQAPAEAEAAPAAELPADFPPEEPDLSTVDQPTIVYDYTNEEVVEIEALDLELEDEDDELDAPADGFDAPADELDAPADEDLRPPPPAEPSEAARSAGPAEAPVGPPAIDEPALDEAPSDELELEDPVELPGEGGPPSAEGDGEAEDVLEETPEFLRDAPEDDELWFEQGEPKDFDF